MSLFELTSSRSSCASNASASLTLRTSSTDIPTASAIAALYLKITYAASAGLAWVVAGVHVVLDFRTSTAIKIPAP